jgi:ATP-binding cassette, subfamily F, member 3
MSILTAENLGVSFGAFDLFGGINLSIANDAKIGLIGPNGVGKTTLLLILAGIEGPTRGQVHLARGRRIGYLRQEAMDAFEDHSNTVYAEMSTVFSGLQEQQARLNQMETQMAGGEIPDDLLEAYGSLLEAFETAGGYDYETRIQQTLQGLGLGKDTWQLPLNHLSGGQKTRALLARLLLEKPDLLMLDEPTNHLDIEAVEWLEKTLRLWEGAILIVSHDRYFLDNSANTIWEMSPAGIEVYKGNYQAYLLQREERSEYYQRVFEEEKARLLNEVDFIQRNWVRASTHARALGLLRKVSREIALVENYGILALRNGMKWSESGLSSDRPLDVVEAIRRVNALRPTHNRLPTIRPRLAATHNSGNIVLRLHKTAIGYPGNFLFTSGDVELRRGECAALIGPNGSGKTTFLKVLLGQLEPLTGQVHLGAGLKIGYFAQAHESLQAEHSIMDELSLHKEMHPGEARSYLAQYQFREEDVFKPLSALSGGERARLALAILALDGVNFLVLDEPTNHLDIAAQEALQDVLEKFTGTILLVSHDRYLIDRLASQVWEIRQKKLLVFSGNYREYILRAETAETTKDGSPRPQTARQAPRLQKPLLRGDSFSARKHIESLERLENRIHEQEALVQRLSLKLQSTRQPQAYEHVHDLSRQFALAQVELERLMGEWERLATS